MDRRNFASWQSTLSRRSFGKTLAALGLGVSVVPLVASRARAELPLTYLTYGGYDIAEFYPSFLAAHGENSVETSLFGDLDEAMQKILGGFTPDVSHCCISNVQRWREAGVSRPIDVSRLQHWNDVWEPLRNMEVIQADGQYWFVPFDWGNASVLYRADLVDEADGESWSMLYNEKYAGKIGAYDAVENVVVAAIVAGVADPFNPAEEDFAKIEELLRRQRDVARFYWSDVSTKEQALASGEIVAAYAWNSSVQALRDQGVDVKFANPREGILTWVCGLTIISDDPENDDLRYEFLDAMLDPAAGQYLIDAYGYGHANQKAFDLVSAERLAQLGLDDPTSFLSRGIFYKAMEESTRLRYLQMFEQAKAG